VTDCAGLLPALLMSGVIFVFVVQSTPADAPSRAAHIPSFLYGFPAPVTTSPAFLRLRARIFLRVLCKDVGEGILHVAAPQSCALGSFLLVVEILQTPILSAAWAAAEDQARDHGEESAAALGRAVPAARALEWLPCYKNTPGSVWFRAGRIRKMLGTCAQVERSSSMKRREKIKLTLERIDLAKKLVAQQTEFISLARKIGYEPVHAPATLQRFRTQLSDERLALIRLTRSAQSKYAKPATTYSLVKAA
jgi:hypothetical protein